jgi:ABC-type dipeptide/oligopeptide/nickel transport system ATPase subunit
MPAAIAISNLCKTYASGLRALSNVSLEIRSGEIFALLGPNGAGKTTLINIVCGIVKATAGTVQADGYDVVRDYRATRSKIGLVPQELATDMFETVWGALIVVEQKAELMKKLGKKQLTLYLQEPLAAVPGGLADWRLALNAGGTQLEYTFDAADERTGIPALLRRLDELGIGFKDLNTRQSSLEEIFVSLVSER